MVQTTSLFAVGNVVLIVDENVHRGKWPLGTVTEVYRGRDGFVRSARVITSSTTFTRPITKLCFLESDQRHSS